MAHPSLAGVQRASFKKQSLALEVDDPAHYTNDEIYLSAGCNSSSPTFASVLGRRISGLRGARDNSPLGITELHIDDELDEFERVLSEAGEMEVAYKDRLKHLLLSLRLRRMYALYCFICCVLSAVVCSSTVFRVAKHTTQGHIVQEHRWQSWETTIEVLIGLAVCAETTTTLWLRGWRSFVRDLWCLFDSLVVILTLLNWCLLLLKHGFGEIGKKAMEDVDLPLFVLRFVLQPFRLCAALSMVRRVTHMHQNTLDISFDVPEHTQIEVNASEESSILTPELRSEISNHLPAQCRFWRWDLIYSPTLHGKSLQTFYRQQVGPNLLVVRDTRGHVFGGFSEDPWNTCRHGQQVLGEAFLFKLRPLEEFLGKSHSISSSMSFYHARSKQDPLLSWANSDMFAISEALVIFAGFENGSSAPCAAFSSPALAEDGQNFKVCDFECWGLSAV